MVVRRLGIAFGSFVIAWLAVTLVAKPSIPMSHRAGLATPAVIHGLGQRFCSMGTTLSGYLIREWYIPSS